MIPRSASEESLLTLYSSITPSELDNASVFSEETVSVSSTKVFGRKLLTYTRIRELPLVVGTIKLDLQLFRSLKDLKDENQPMFTIQLNKLHFLKKNAPLLTTYYNDGNTKQEFSKVYFKILLNNLTCHVIMFANGENVVLFNDALKPHTDAIYKGTKFRLFGALGASSTFGNGQIKLFLLQSGSPALTDGLDHQKLDAAKTIKDMDLGSFGETPFFSAVAKQDRSAVLKLLALASPLVSVPYASYVDNGDEKLDGVRVTGSIRLFESVEELPEAEIARTSLVMANIMLVLIEQEMRKMRGTNKPLYVTG